MTSNDVCPCRAMCLTLFIGVLTILVSGCDDSGFETVTGVVTYNGKPVPDATVAFIPKDKTGRSAFGTTDTEGKYQLSTLSPNDGVAIGDYHVTVTAVDIVESEGAKKMADEFGSLAGDMPTPPPKETWRVPESFSEKESSGLEFTVEHGSRSADWTLQ